MRGDVPDRQARSAEIGEEQIERYVAHLRSTRLKQASADIYQKILNDFYQDLPKDKRVDQESLPRWQKRLLETGYAQKTVNQRIYIVNGFLDHLGLREFQLTDGLEAGEPEEPAPELTRWEYQRLLQTAKVMDKEWLYLLVKAFALTGLPVQCLDELTVAAVSRGRFSVEYKMGRQTIRIPKGLQKELADYASRESPPRGPVFVTRTGRPMHRSYVNSELRKLCADARVPEEKGSPRSLRRLYLRTREEIEDSVRAQVERSYDQMIEREQLTVGWNV